MKRPPLILFALTLLVLVAPGTVLAEPPEWAQDEHAHTHGPDPIDIDRRGHGHGHGEDPGASGTIGTVPPWTAGEYDGLQASSDVLDLPEYASLPTFHAIYLYPKSSANRFSQVAPMIQADARNAGAVLEKLTGRSVRWDERMTSGRRLLDITVVRSRYKSQQLGNSNQFGLVRDEIRALGFTNANKKYVVWLDAPSNYCGQGELYGDQRRDPANWNEIRTTAIIYRPYGAGGVPDFGFCRGTVVLHEMGHNMGAVQAGPAVNDGAHCFDARGDVMCYDGVATTGLHFDWHNDNYWDPAADPFPEPGDPDPAVTPRLGWWTVNLSRFICPAVGTQVVGSDGSTSTAWKPDCTKPNQPVYGP